MRLHVRRLVLDVEGVDPHQLGLALEKQLVDCVLLGGISVVGVVGAIALVGLLGRRRQRNRELRLEPRGDGDRLRIHSRRLGLRLWLRLGLQPQA